ncbi:NAD(P)/FAD-dependent oxidoreductase [Pseudoponticoccus marisrubri]|uniref:Oxidoreductase n=1 Tax=Pseudoponticoccus marisrubri TaxID=1685382 RepID=A0A0W7WL18_9RHOB|nr:FAD-binding oxidoreductase [Pseudoponticoccus marisrubri]KUF11275.1 oxidoreductase [Pseudoponticoccus marisrubri]
MTGPSLWQDSAEERFAAAPLAGDLDVDLAVIGGGFTGCSAALAAARRGASVALCEAQSIGFGGSGRNVGLVNAGLWLPPDSIAEVMGEEAGHRLTAALGAAPDRVFDTIKAENIACEPVRAGTLHLAHSAGAVSDLAERARQGNRHGAPIRLLDAEETAERVGSPVYHGALFDPRAGTVQPLAYCAGLARAARDHGAQLFEHTPATGVARREGQWEVQTPGGQVRARRLLVATNAYHQGLSGAVRPRFTTVHFSQFATAPLSAAQRARILPGGEGCWDTGLIMSSVRMDRAGRLIVGGMGNVTGPGRAVHAAWAGRLLRRLFPDLGPVGFGHAWQGRIAMTADHVPKIVGFGPGAYAVFGYSGRGIAPGTVFGMAVAEALLDDSPEGLPVAPVDRHGEVLTGLRSAWVEFGATLVHAMADRGRR